MPVPRVDDGKDCKRCARWLPNERFYRNRSRPDGLHYYCKDCTNDMRRSWRARNPEKRYAQEARRRKANPETVRAASRRKHIRAAFGLTVEDHDALLVNGCEICGTHSALCIDHNHASGAVRGALCRTCNSGIGFFADDPSKLAKAIEYLVRSLQAGRTR